MKPDTIVLAALFVITIVFAGAALGGCGQG